MTILFHLIWFRHGHNRISLLLILIKIVQYKLLPGFELIKKKDQVVGIIESVGEILRYAVEGV